MSRRPGAVYVDRLSEGGTELEYEGHDARKEAGIEPKKVDQPEFLPTGSLTENGRFVAAVDRYKSRIGPAAKVRVYEKLRPGVWSDKGLFDLVDCEYPGVGGRRVYRFKMRLSPEPEEESALRLVADAPVTRAIPSAVKAAVYKRDKGQCVLCGEKDHLHFDHDLPYSRGGTSILVENVRLLCARHNLQKAAKIE
jgi:hypothetical protein